MMCALAPLPTKQRRKKHIPQLMQPAQGTAVTTLPVSRITVKRWGGVPMWIYLCETVWISAEGSDWNRFFGGGGQVSMWAWKRRGRTAHCAVNVRVEVAQLLERTHHTDVLKNFHSVAPPAFGQISKVFLGRGVKGGFHRR